MAIYCCYKDCRNVQRAFSSKTFFNLPNDSRREIWIKNSGNRDLHDIGSTQRRLFCEDHFDPMYLRCQFNRTTLRRDAVPYSFEDAEEPHEIEYIEMDEIEDENDEQVEQPQVQATEMNNDPNNVVILVNNTQNAQIFTENATQKAKKPPKSTDASASKRVILKKDSSSLEHPSTDDNNAVELELDLIVVDEKKTEQSTIKSNENGQKSTTRKRLRLDVEPLISLGTESSQNVKKEMKSPSVPVSVRSELLRPRKSIEEIVSSSEGIDTNSEDKYFALSILGTLRRLTPHKRALAKCHILSYLTEIEYGNSNSTT